MIRRPGVAEPGWLMRLPPAALAAGVPLLAGAPAVLILAGVAALLLLTLCRRGPGLVTGGLLVAAEVGAGPGGGWGFGAAAVSAAGLVALGFVGARRLVWELGVGAAVAVLLALLPAARSVPSTLAGLAAAGLLIALLGTASRPAGGRAAAHTGPNHPRR